MCCAAAAEGRGVVESGRQEGMGAVARGGTQPHRTRQCGTVEVGGEANVEHEAVWEMVLPMMKIRMGG